MSDDAKTMCEGKYLRLVKRGHWEYAERTNAGSAVIVIAVTPERKLLFVEQFRIPMGAPTIEMPAGLVGDLDAADTMEEAARRELLENRLLAVGLYSADGFWQERETEAGRLRYPGIPTTFSETPGAIGDPGPVLFRERPDEDLPQHQAGSLPLQQPTA